MVTNWTREQAERAYRNDPEFHAMVQIIAEPLRKMRLTASDVRAAAMMACVLIESERPGPPRGHEFAP